MKLLLALGALLAAAPAFAESPRLGSFELTLNNYRPSIDQEFGGAARPYYDAFGGGRALMVRGQVAKSLFTGYGSLEVGLGAGYAEKYGHGQVSTTNARASDSTAFKVIPVRLSLTYRFDLLADRWNIPLAPYGRLSLERWNWWIQNGSGNTSNSNGLTGSGATNGWSMSGGLCLMLDFFDPGVAREMDRDLGINHTYLFVDFTKNYIDDFGSSKSWNLSDDKTTISGGLLFVF